MKLEFKHTQIHVSAFTNIHKYLLYKGRTHTVHPTINGIREDRESPYHWASIEDYAKKVNLKKL